MTPEERIDNILANATWGMSEQTEKDRKAEAKASLLQMLDEGYRKGYKTGHARGTYGLSKRKNQTTIRQVCPICKSIAVSTQLNPKEKES